MSDSAYSAVKENKAVFCRLSAVTYFITAVICSRCLSMREPQNQQNVTLYKCDKTKQVIKRTHKALRSGTKFVYSKLRGAKLTGNHTQNKVRMHVVCSCVVCTSVVCTRMVYARVVCKLVVCTQLSCGCDLRVCVPLL